MPDYENEDYDEYNPEDQFMAEDDPTCELCGAERSHIHGCPNLVDGRRMKKLKKVRKCIINDYVDAILDQIAAKNMSEEEAVVLFHRLGYNFSIGTVRSLFEQYFEEE